MSEIEVIISADVEASIAIDAVDGNLGAIVSDASTSVEKSLIKVPFSWGDATPKFIYTVQGLVHRASILILEGFDTPSYLALGDDLDQDRLVSRFYNNPLEVAEFEATPLIVYPSPTSIKLLIVPGVGNTRGKGFVVLEV